MPPSRFELTTPGLQNQRVANELNVAREARAKKLVGSWNNIMRFLLELTEELQIKNPCFFLQTDIENWFLKKWIRV